MDHIKGLVVLLLEDEPFVAIDIEDSLIQAGPIVKWLMTCAQSEAWLVDNSPAAAVIDMTLPDGVCVESARILAERGIPFIIHSGHDDKVDGFDVVFQSGTWVAKPSDPRQLADTLREMTSQRQCNERAEERRARIT